MTPEDIRGALTDQELRYDELANDPDMAEERFERAYASVEATAWRMWRRYKRGVKTWHQKPRQLKLNI